jgi:2'-5' RNA ligase
VHYVLCYPKLDAKDLARIEAFRRIHEPSRAKLAPAHITLVFGVTSVDAAVLAALASAVAATTAAFDVSLDKIEVNVNEGGADNTMSLIVGQGHERIIALHQALHAGALAKERRHDITFAPHMTIATDADYKRVLGAIGDARAIALPIKGRIETLEVETLVGDALLHVAASPLVGSS